MKLVVKNNYTIAIAKNLSDKSNYFYLKRYSNWEKSSFWVYDFLSNPNKVFIDVGGWNGCTAIYAAIQNKHVISIEPDPESLKDYYKMIKENRVDNVSVIEKPLFNEVTSVNFSPLEDTWNTSSSHIKETRTPHSKKMTSITFEDINSAVKNIMNTDIHSKTVSMIKIDIEGNEQYLLPSLRKLQKNIPLYISFHIEWWTNKDVINGWTRLFDKFKFIYATTSYGVEDGDTVFIKLKHKQVVNYLKFNPFTSLVLVQKELSGVPQKKLINRFQGNLLSQFFRG